MNTNEPRKGLSSAKVIKLIIGIAVFAVLMGIRSEFDDRWVRALVAACAFGTLAWAIVQATKRHA